MLNSVLRMTCSLCVFWKDHPVKVVTMLVSFPNFVAAGCFDAFPQKTKTITTRFYFVFNTFSLAMLAGAVITTKTSDTREISLLVFSRTIPVSSLALSAIGSIFPFSMKSLAMTVCDPGLLAGMEGDIVSVKFDPAVLGVFQAAQKLLCSRLVRITKKDMVVK